MFKRDLIITNADYEILIKMAKEIEQSETKRDNLYILGKRLKTAKILFPKDMPSNIVTLDSIVCFINLARMKGCTYQLVVPSKADMAKNMISVLSPVGTALLGALTGEIVCCKVPTGKLDIRIENIIYQPERDNRGSHDYYSRSVNTEEAVPPGNASL